VEDVFLRSECSRIDARRRFGIPLGAFVVLQMGRIHPLKGIDLLIKAWSLVEAGHEGLLWIVGPGKQSHIGHLRHLAKQLGVSQDVRFEGPLYDSFRAPAYRAADVVTLCSHKENFGLSAAEAMASGVPVLVSDKVNLAPDILQSRCGLICSLTSGAIARALSQLKSFGQSGREAMGRAGREWAQTHFGWASVAEQTREMYQQALAGSLSETVF
jgi:glycosyltransferase involved in cell wall biosynthesis